MGASMAMSAPMSQRGCIEGLDAVPVALNVLQRTLSALTS